MSKAAGKQQKKEAKQLTLVEQMARQRERVLGREPAHKPQAKTGKK